MYLKLKDDIKPISYLKSHTVDILKRISERHNSIVITQSGEAKAVLIDIESYQKIMNALGIMRLIAIGEKDVEKGRVIESQKAIDSIRKKMKTKAL
ncbi:MAG: type II toxin-antitoxin system Phd/YefM family antitoxin [Elusimicrobiota bacterium]